MYVLYICFCCALVLIFAVMFLELHLIHLNVFKHLLYITFSGDSPLFAHMPHHMTCQCMVCIPSLKTIIVDFPQDCSWHPSKWVIICNLSHVLLIILLTPSWLFERKSGTPLYHFFEGSRAPSLWTNNTHTPVHDSPPDPNQPFLNLILNCPTIDCSAWHSSPWICLYKQNCLNEPTDAQVSLFLQWLRCQMNRKLKNCLVMPPVLNEIAKALLKMVWMIKKENILRRWKMTSPIMAVKRA